MRATANALRWAELWFGLWDEQIRNKVPADHAERQMWLALLFWAGMPCGQ